MNTMNTGRSVSYSLEENHRRILTVNLSMMEKELILLEFYITHPPRGRMFGVKSNLTSEEAEKVLKSIDTVRRCIGEFADCFGLRPIEEDIRSKINSDFIIDGADMYGLEPERLMRGYGQMEPDAVVVFDRYVQKLRTLLNFRI